jgi:hypothetical protein
VALTRQANKRLFLANVAAVIRPDGTQFVVRAFLVGHADPLHFIHDTVGRYILLTKYQRTLHTAPGLSIHRKFEFIYHRFIHQQVVRELTINEKNIVVI